MKSGDLLTKGRGDGRKDGRWKPLTGSPRGASDWGCVVEAGRGDKGGEGRRRGEEGGGVREECKSFGVRGARCSKYMRARNKFREKISESYAFGTFFADM